METNNAEQATEETQAVVEDTSGTTETNAIEAGETATGEQSSGAESEEQTSAESDLVYDIDGEEVPASTVLEWKKGHMLQSDYTKKRQADAEFRKQLEAKAQEVDGVKAKLSETLTSLEAIIEKESNPEELAQLRDENTSEYLKRKEEIEDRKKLAEEARKELADIEKKQNAEKIAQEKEKLLEALPDWQDPSKQKADVEMLNAYAEANDLSTDDINALTSHKLMLMALDAAKYQKLKQETGKTAKQVADAPKAVKPRAREQVKEKSMAELFYGKK